jgi:hypothetical protein
LSAPPGARSSRRRHPSAHRSRTAARRAQTASRPPAGRPCSGSKRSAEP